MSDRTIDTDRLLEQATEVSGLSDFGDLPFREGLDVYAWALEHESGNLPAQLEQLSGSVVDLLVKRLRLVDDRKRYPEIATQRVEAPLFILGLPRTGSTHLHALLATRPGSRAPLQWEMARPSPPPEAATFETDPRIAEVQAEIDARSHADVLQAIHPYGARRPEQCLGLIDWSFVNQTFLAKQRLPSYYEWLLCTDHRPMYEHHRRVLQHLQSQYPGAWVLKWPKHVFALDALLDVYPDARIVWTHRDPGSVIPSAVSFVGTIRRLSSPLFHPARFGAEWVALEEMGLHRALSVRDRLGEDGRFCDVHYNDLMADPVGTTTRVYEHFGMPVDDEIRRRVGGFQDDNPKGKHGQHQYTADLFGLDTDAVRRRFATYIERFRVEPDRARTR